MPKLPIVSAKQLLKVCHKLGYQIIRQKGSHIRLKHFHNPERQPLTVPDHRVIGKGLLRKILRDMKITVEDFSKLL